MPYLVTGGIHASGGHYPRGSVLDELPDDLVQFLGTRIVEIEARPPEPQATAKDPGSQVPGSVGFDSFDQPKPAPVRVQREERIQIL